MFKSIAAGLLALAATAASAQQVTIQVGYGPGGSYDVTARLVADHLGRFLPGNPAVVVENVPGAGSMKLAKLTMEAGAADGTQIAMVSSALALLPVFDPGNTDFDPLAAHYLASMTNSASYCITPKASGIDTLDKFLTEEFKVGATGPDSTTYIFPAAIKNALDANYEIVTGFKSAAEIDLGMERGDLQARCGIGLTTLSQGDMMERFNIITEMSVTPKNELEGVPFLLDRVTDEKLRAAVALTFSSSEVHLPFLVGPAVPDDVVATLRNAFDAMGADPDFVADAAQRGVELHYTGGARVQEMIEGFANADPEIKEMARTLAQ